MHVLLLESAAVSGLTYRDSDPVFGVMLFKALLVTALLLALAVGLLLLAKRFGWLPTDAAGRQASDTMQIAASRRLTPHTRLFVIQHGEREFLLVESSRQINLRQSTASGMERKT